MATTGMLDRPCFVCNQPIRVQRDEVHGKWLKFNLDGSEHVDERKRGGGGGVGSSGGGLAERISNLEEAVKKLSGQVETLTELIRRQPK